MSELWIEKYRPKQIADFIFKDQRQQKMIETWVSTGSFPGHMLFSGIQGTGKTSLAKLCLGLFLQDGHIARGDILEINASNERNIETLRTKILGFCQTYSLGGGLKYILLDEADYLNKESVQPALRNVMEKYADNVRFILTANYPNKIIAALHSRVQQVEFADVDVGSFFTRMSNILINEDIKFDESDLAQYVQSSYPDMRKCINLLQQNSHAGELDAFSTDEAGSTPDYVLEANALIVDGKINAARKLITSQASEEEYNEIYRWMYQNLELWGDDEEVQNQAIILIARYLRNDAVVADREINLAACMVELANLRK
ncbi:MAG: AAA family ATPase [Richelia sp. RM2_1_2]|nr:AAA family ATPase [Richelia sp. RM2_1_2]